MERPLADEIRPQSLDDVVGQKHLIGPGGLLRRLIDSAVSANMIFYGPSGTGKTTIANIIASDASQTQRHHCLSFRCEGDYRGCGNAVGARRSAALSRRDPIL